MLTVLRRTGAPLLLVSIVAAVAVSADSASAQTPPAAAGTTTVPAVADKPPLKREELEQLLAPIALYPDSLLTQMLMAATYPLEVVQADRSTLDFWPMRSEIRRSSAAARGGCSGVPARGTSPQVFSPAL